MALHDDLMAEYALPVLVEYQGETGWQYAPHSGAASDIDVMVSISEATDATPLATGLKVVRTVRVPIGGTRGIDPLTLNTGADRLTGPEYPGGSSRSWRIIGRPTISGGMLVMRIE
jgi:hypothetical protein